MLDIRELDAGLKLKAVARIFNSGHPMNRLVKDKIRFNDYFDVDLTNDKLDLLISNGLKLLCKLRKSQLNDRRTRNDLLMNTNIRQSLITSFVKKECRGNLHLFMLNRRGVLRVGELDRRNLNLIKNIIDGQGARDAISNAIDLNLAGRRTDLWFRMAFINAKWKDMTTLTSKEFRNMLFPKRAIQEFKCGLTLSEGESLSYFRQLNKITGIRNRCAVLRFIHGDYYSGSRLFKFRLKDTPFCEYCNELETVNHKIFECQPVKDLWTHVIENSSKLDVQIAPSDTLIKKIVGSISVTNVAMLTLHSEVIMKIMSKDFVCPLGDNRKTLVKNIIRAITIKESKSKIRDELYSLLTVD
jgi:hypothetical protein